METHLSVLAAAATAVLMMMSAWPGAAPGQSGGAQSQSASVGGPGQVPTRRDRADAPLGGPVWPLPGYSLIEVDQAPAAGEAAEGSPNAMNRVWSLDLDRGPWAAAPSAGPFLNHGRPEPDGRRTVLKMLTCKGVLHVAVRCRDDRPEQIRAKPDGPDIHSEDCLQLAIALGGQQTYPLLTVQLDAAGGLRVAREPAPQPMWRASLSETLDGSPVKAATGRDKQGWWAVVELPTPGSNAGKINGRDHNHWGFTMWMAGGGVKGGQVYGATDEFGFQAVENRVHVHDLHATMLKLLGFDHEQLTYRYAGRDFRLTDVHGHVVDELIA